MSETLAKPFANHLVDPHPEGGCPPLVINACLTGMVPTKEANPHLPVSSEEIIADALAVVEAGASILHLHAREADGSPAWRPEVFAPIIAAIRRACPATIIGVTTSGRKVSGVAQRAAVLDLSGAARPDMASLTLGSMNFPAEASVNPPEVIRRLAEIMREKGIAPELEIFEPGMLNYALYLARKGVLPERCYVNFILGSLGTSPARVLDLANLAREVPPGWLWAGAGVGRYQLAMNTAAMVMGGHVRVGLEDNLYYDVHKSRLATNLELVERLVRLAGELGRPIATPVQARKLLNLPASPGGAGLGLPPRPAG